MGPNTNHGSGSVPYTLQCQFNYVLDGIRRLREGNLRWIDLKPEVQARWREEIDERSQRTQWVTGGCSNWYVNGEGINTNNWPGPWLEFRRRTLKVESGRLPRRYARPLVRGRRGRGSNTLNSIRFMVDCP